MSSSHRAGAAGFVVLAVIIAVAACSSPEDRAAHHRARAQQMLDEPEGLQSIREAALELRNAVALDPTDPESKMLLGHTLLRMGVVDEAIAYLEEAHEIAPDDIDIQVELARALFFTDPARSLELADAAREADPDHLGALLLAAEAQAMLGEYELALARLVEAERLAPGHADVEWSRARVYEAKIRALRLKPGRTLFDGRDFEAAAAAYDGYIAKGGERPATVMLSKAKLYSGWPGHAEDAVAAYIEAADLADDDPLLAETAMEGLASYARATGDEANRLRALEHLTELDPTRIDRWEERVRVAADAGQPTAPILERMLDAVGDDPRAHVVYARSLWQEQGLDAAVDHLRSRIEATDDDALLLSQLVQLQMRAGHPLDAERTLAELQIHHPDDVQTRLLLARRALRDGNADEAVTSLQDVAQTSGNRDALRLWARATEATGQLDAALAIVERTIEASPELDASLWAWKADLLRRLGRPEDALAALKRLDWGDELTPAQRLLRAQCEYDLGRRIIGRQRLTDLLQEPSPPIEAVLEFHLRERDHAPSLPLARQSLMQAHARAPGRIDVLEALVDVDLLMDQPGAALQRVTLALARSPQDARLYTLRARVQLVLGHLKQARADAERALILDPGRGDEALSVLLTLSEASAEPDRAIAVLEAQSEQDAFPVHRKVVLGRMLVANGRVDDGLALLEEALAEGAEYTTLKADVARLLVLRGGDLDRAEQLAKSAVDTPGVQVEAADALGTVYMAKGLHDAAMWQFQFAAENAVPPNADYLDHLGRALEAMQRTDAARDAYARALEIDPGHAHSREALGALGAPPAPPQTDPS